MKMLQFSVLFACLCATEPLYPVLGDLHSTTNLTPSINLKEVKDLILIREINGRKILVAKIKYGVLVENQCNRYKLDGNGTSLVISNLTRDDPGTYIIDFTLLNDKSLARRINLTLHSVQKEEVQTKPTEDVVTPTQETKETNQRSRKPMIILCIMAVVIVAILWRCWKIYLCAPGQDKKEEGMQTNQNENALMEHKNNQENEENFRNLLEEMVDQNENVLLGHKNNEHEDEENLRIPVEETENPMIIRGLILKCNMHGSHWKGSR